MGQYLSNLTEKFNNGLRGFSERPIQYSYSAAKDFAKDYWDLGAMVLAGFAFNDHGGEVLGGARFPVMLASGIAGLSRCREDADRAGRNIYAGLASLSGFWNRGLDVPLSGESANYGVGLVLSALSLYMDRKRRGRESRKAQAARSESSQLEVPLETLVK